MIIKSQLQRYIRTPKSFSNMRSAVLVGFPTQVGFNYILLQAYKFCSILFNFVQFCSIPCYSEHFRASQRNSVQSITKSIGNPKFGDEFKTKLPSSAKNCQVLPRTAKFCQELPSFAKNCLYSSQKMQIAVQLSMNSGVYLGIPGLKMEILRILSVVPVILRFISTFRLR